MKRFAVPCLGILLAAIVLPASAASVSEILERSRRAYLPGDDMRARIQFVMTNEDGERVLWEGQTYRIGGEEPKVRIAFDHPSDMRGVEFTAVQADDRLDRMRFHLPALRRTRALRTEMLGTSFLGTDFTYETLGLEDLDFQRHELVGEETLDGEPVWKIVSKPDEERLWYGRIVRYVDRDSYLPMRTEYYDRAGILYRVRTIDEVKKVNGYPTPTVITMTTKPEDTTTTLRFREIEYDTSFDRGLAEASPKGRTPAAVSGGGESRQARESPAP